VDAAVAAILIGDRQLLGRLDSREIAQLEPILKLMGGLELPDSWARPTRKSDVTTIEVWP
jgi:hypothetical protein